MVNHAPARRPRISAPLGPVKSSRGPDLCRSQDLRVIRSIDDCQIGYDAAAAAAAANMDPGSGAGATLTTSATTATLSSIPIASKTRFRRLSASFLSSQPPPPSTPAVAADSFIHAGPKTCFGTMPSKTARSALTSSCSSKSFLRPAVARYAFAPASSASASASASASSSSFSAYRDSP
ncbi:hypothetical protein AAL_02009 [Moelleriella libera RCEF 2490]|uniref:Uncharacterized protein n=1 Tax=Moelleriella libera RCEF 2490 TaxID=1081109 RepID=A0A168F3M1_9HYPO|nr:hypothetical protein AAL_02009 [Moelleriella libera RCEF 2490]